jgi:predicted transposase/invertase (TIGR01784 family)
MVVDGGVNGDSNMECGLLKPSSDFVFSNLFGEEKHKRVLICLLNSILKGKPTIKSITLLNPQHKKQWKNGKSTTLDVKARTDDGSIVDIEIQCKRDGNLVNRAFNHKSRIIKSELSEGDTYDSCPDIISIWLTNYPETNRKYHTHEAVYMFKANPFDDVEVASEKMRTFIIELPKIDLKEASVNDVFLVWMYFLKKPELIPFEFLEKVPEVNEALEELKVMSADERMRQEYENHIRAENDRINREANAKAEGLVEGEAKGKAEGEAKGKAEKARETAIAMLARGLEVDIVSQCTGLSVEDVDKLKG